MRLKISIFIYIFFSVLNVNSVFSIQDEMAIGRFSPGESKYQLVIFHFARGKTFFRFFENLSDSKYMFPTFEIIVKGQLLEKPVIDDINGDGLLDISYKTTAEQGVAYFDTKQEKFIVLPKEKIKKKTFTIQDELNLLDNDSQKN